MIWYTIPYNTIHYHNTIRYDTTRHEELSSAPWTRGGRRAWARPQFSYRCLRNKRPLQKRTLRLSNPCPPKINTVRVTSGSGSACKINTRFRKTGSALAFQLWTWGGTGAKITLWSYLLGRALILQTPVLLKAAHRNQHRYSSIYFHLYNHSPF